MDTAGLLIAGASLVTSIVALVVAVLAWRRADRNSSAATLVAISEGLRTAWERFLATDPDDEVATAFQFAELVNLLELACAILVDKAVHGTTRELLDQYVAKALKILAGNQPACDRIEALREDPDTFKYVRRYISGTNQMRDLAPLFARVVNPPSRLQAIG